MTVVIVCCVYSFKSPTLLSSIILFFPVIVDSSAKKRLGIIKKVFNAVCNWSKAISAKLNRMHESIHTVNTSNIIMCLFEHRSLIHVLSIRLCGNVVIGFIIMSYFSLLFKKYFTR